MVESGGYLPAWRESAVVFQVLLALYLQIVEWVPLGRWNNIRNGNGQEVLDVLIGATQIVIGFVYFKGWRWPMLGGFLVYLGWAYLQVTSWWIPYFRGGSPQMMRFYQHWFGATYKFLPPIGNHPIPDAEHTILSALILLVLISSAGVLREAFRKA